MIDALLTLTEVSFRYPGAPQSAVQQVSLQPQPGEVFGLLGPNGAGKSTLMALISGLLTAQSGQIDRRAKRFALVPQELAFYPMLSCRENLEFFAGVQGLRGAQARQRVQHCIELAQLQAAAGQRAAQCSGGLKRRLNFAIGMLTDPDLLLLDEPTVGVDPQSRAHLLAAVASLRQQGKTLIYTSHYMDEVQALCDRLAIIDHGRVLVQGRLDALLTEATPVLRVRFAALPADPAWQRLPDGFAALPVEGQDHRFGKTDAQHWSSLLAHFEHHGLHCQQLQYGHRHLEDLFLQLTHRTLRD